MKHNSQLHSDSKVKAEILNEQFTSVFTTENTNQTPDMEDKVEEIKQIVISRKGLLNLLKDINVHKATGPDNISGKLLKTVCEEVVDALVLIFQSSLDCGKLPLLGKKHI